MARSYKKTPIIKDNTRGRKFAKKQANRKVRRYKGYISDGKSYRKLYCSYDIYDYISYCPYKDYKEMYKDEFYRKLRKWETEKDCYRDWRRSFLNK